MTLHAFVLACVFWVAPATPPERAEEIYDAISAATEDPDEAAALVTTWYHESQFRPAVRDCRVLGDGGRAAGAFQLWPHWRGGFGLRDFCRTPSLQAQLALRALRRCRGDGGPRRAFARFLGRPGGDAEVLRRLRTYERLRRLAEVLGPAALPYDRWARGLGLYALATAAWPKLPPQVKEAITAYAARWAGSSLDLDPELEAAGLEHWLDAEKGGR